MANMTIARVRKDLSIRLPRRVVQRLGLRQGDRVAIEEEESRVLVHTVADGNPAALQDFSTAVTKLRSAVKRAGGVSQEEIDEAVRKARSSDARRCR